MMYEVLNSECLVIKSRFKSESDAIKHVTNKIGTSISPKFIRQADGEITALIYCDVVYRPTDEGLSNA